MRRGSATHATEAPPARVAAGHAETPRTGERGGTCEGGRIAATTGDGNDLQPQLLARRFFVVEDHRVVGQAHDLEGLVDDGREAAEGDLAAFVDHLLDDFDEDADADGVDDFRIAKVQQQRAHTVVHQFVGARGDLFAAYIVDVALGVEHCTVALAVDRDFQFLSHDSFFSYLTIWMVVPPPDDVEMLTSSMCASISCSPRPRL